VAEAWDITNIFFVYVRTDEKMGT